MFFDSCSTICPGVVPVLVGPILTVLPGILLAALGGIIRLFSPTGFRNAVKLLWRQKLAVAVIGLASAGVVWGCLTFLAGSAPVADTAAEQGRDWTTARGDLRRTGAMAGTKSPANSKVIWNHKSEILASPAVVGNRLYVTAAYLPSRGEIFCLDADTGKVVWANAPDNYRPTFSSPVIAGNYLVCGEGLHETRDARVVCLDIRPEKKGEVVWTFTTKNHVECTPVVHDNRVYVGAGDDGIYCLDLKPGPDSQARMIWHVPNTMYIGPDGKQFKDHGHDVTKYGLKNARFQEGISAYFKTETKDGKEVAIALYLLAPGEKATQARPGLKSGTIQKIDHANSVLTMATSTGENVELLVSEYADAETGLAVHDGKVYAGLGNDSHALAVLDAATGKQLKRLDMPYPVFGPPSLANGKLYIGMGVGDYVKPGDEEYDGGEVRCLNLDTLETEWKYPLKKTVLGAVAIKEEDKKPTKLYFGCADGTLYCLSDKGKLLGKFDVLGAVPIKTSAAVTDEAVYFVTERGMLIALDRHTLEPIWDYPLGKKQFFISSPVVARGHVYVGTEKDGIFCIGDAVPKTPFWPNPLGGLNRTGNDDESVFPYAWEVHWTYPSPGDKLENVRIPAAVARWGDDLFVPITSAKKSGLACLPRNAPAGAMPRPRWFFDADGQITQASVVLNDSVLMTVGGLKSKDPNRLISVNRESGAQEWEMPIDGSGVLTVTTKQILVQDRPDHLTSRDGKGKRLWSRPVGSLSKDRHLYPMTAGNIIVVATAVSAAELGFEGRPALMALDRDSGTLIWKVPLDGPPRTSPFVVRTVIYLGTSSGLEARSLLNGKVLPGWECRAGPPSAEFAVPSSEPVIYYVNQAGEVVVVDRATGAVKGRKSQGTEDANALPGFPPLPSRDQALAVTDKGLALAVFRDVRVKGEFRLELWEETGELGPLTAPALFTGSRLFVPTKKGLVCIGGK